jgi:hypothetical protein
MMFVAAGGVAWVLFLEKAFAIMFGNYSKLQNRDPYLPLQCLTGEMDMLQLHTGSKALLYGNPHST